MWGTVFMDSNGKHGCVVKWREEGFCISGRGVLPDLELWEEKKRRRRGKGGGGGGARGVSLLPSQTLATLATHYAEPQTSFGSF